MNNVILYYNSALVKLEFHGHLLHDGEEKVCNVNDATDAYAWNASNIGLPIIMNLIFAANRFFTSNDEESNVYFSVFIASG